MPEDNDFSFYRERSQGTIPSNPLYRNRASSYDEEHLSERKLLETVETATVEEISQWPREKMQSALIDFLTQGQMADDPDKIPVYLQKFSEAFSTQKWSWQEIDDCFETLESSPKFHLMSGSLDMNEFSETQVDLRNTLVLETLNAKKGKIPLEECRFIQTVIKSSISESVIKDTNHSDKVLKYNTRLADLRSDQLLKVITNHEELIQPFHNEIFFQSHELADNLMQQVKKWPLEEQYVQKKIFQNYFINRAINKDETVNYLETIKDWELSQRQQLLDDLVPPTTIQIRAGAANSAMAMLMLDQGKELEISPSRVSSLLHTHYSKINYLDAYNPKSAVNKASVDAYWLNYGKENGETLYAELANVAIQAAIDIDNENFDAQKFFSYSELTKHFSERFENIAEIRPYLPEKIQSILDLDDFESVEHLFSFITEHKKMVQLALWDRSADMEKIMEEDHSGLRMDRYHMDLLKDGTLPFDSQDLEVILRSGIDFSESTKDESVYKKAWKSLEESHLFLDDDDVVTANFPQAAEVFGYRKMFKYMNSEKVSKHDALHAFGDIIDLFKASGMKSKAFYGNILFQVSMDGASYDEGTAYHKLNTIASTLDTDIQSQLDEARAFAESANLEALQPFLEKFKSPQDVFESWSNLKLYVERIRILEEREFLEQLHQLHEAGKHELADYIEQLMFHKDSKISAQAIGDFLFNPRGFFEKKASHTETRVHDRKKPSNYVMIPNLDLTAEQLRDTLVEKKLDEIQAFSPMKVEYQIPIIKGLPKPTLASLVKSMLEDRTFDADDQSLLKSQLTKQLGAQNASLEDFFDHQLDISPEFEQGLQEIVFSSPLAEAIEWQEAVMEIHRKSDPKAVIAGDDTVNCMPFGDGKSTVYTFNLNTCQLTLQIKTGEDTQRTIAQSVLTKDRDVKREVPEILSDLERTNIQLPDVVPQDVLTSAPAYIAADNIEVAPNWAQNYQEVIETLYGDFFQKYLQEHASDQNFNQEKVVIGTGYTDALKGLPKEANTFIPQAPVSYSDKYGPEVLSLNLVNRPALAASSTQVENSGSEMTLLGARPTNPLIQFLTYEDSLGVGYLESKAYEGNPELIGQLHNMENALIAMQINNIDKARPHMSLKYVDDAGKMQGYMLAYEGKLDSENNYRKEDWKQTGERVLFVSDWSADPDHQLAGGRMMLEFIHLYGENYLGNDDFVPIYAEARDTTSYRILQRQLERLSAEIGITFEMEEFKTKQVGKNQMHPVMIRPVRE